MERNYRLHRKSAGRDIGTQTGIQYNEIIHSWPKSVEGKILKQIG
jgi:hypothetical protein